MKVFTIFFISFLILSPNVNSENKDDFKKHQTDLNKLKSDIEKSEKNLEKLRKNENKAQKKLANSKQKINADKKVIRELNKELNQIKKHIANAQNELENRTEILELGRRRFLGNIRQFYLTAHQTDREIFSEDPNEEMLLSIQIIYLSSLAGYESENVQLAENLLMETIDKKDELTSENKRIAKYKRTKTTSLSLAQSIKKKQEKDLKKVQNKKKHEVDRMLTLKQAAEEMERIIVQLQEEAIKKAQDEKSQTTSFFVSLKGQLLSPFKGKVIESFGDKIDKRNIRTNNPSISIKGKIGGNVKSVASGTIAYVGELRGYGNFIIINHDDRFFTTYAGLGDIYVQKDSYILAGKKIASVGTDGVLRFEIRDRRTPVDPVEWIQIESFR